MYRAADTSEPRRSGLAAWDIVWAVVPWFTIATGLVLRALVSSRRGPGFAANTFAEWYSAHSVAGAAAVLIALTVLAIAWCVVFVRRRTPTV